MRINQKTNFILIFLLVLSLDVSAFAKEMKLTSSAFKNNGMIPSLYTCDGKNISPPLMWGPVPDNTQSLALICDDLDAPAKKWVHWIIYNIDSSIKRLPAKVLTQKKLLNGAFHGINDFGEFGYGGPCPPSGTHRYFFKLYALDRTLDLEPGATKEQLEEEMEGHIISKTELVGRYK